jgi:endonuclease YncB( thermonuclease family)
LAQQVRSSYEGLLIALPPEHWPRWHGDDPAGLAQHLLRLARNINPRQAATSKRGPKTAKLKKYVDGKTARAHVATARILAQAKARP